MLVFACLSALTVPSGKALSVKSSCLSMMMEVAIAAANIYGVVTVVTGWFSVLSI